MKKWAVGAVAVVLLLAGCSSATTPDAAEAPIPVETTQAAEAATPAAPAEVTEDASSADFIAAARMQWEGEQLADDEYLSYGKAACAALASGQSQDQVNVYSPGTENDAWNNDRIVFYATQTLCTEYKQY